VPFIPAQAEAKTSWPVVGGCAETSGIINAPGAEVNEKAD
jgi:hypothetical protein